MDWNLATLIIATLSLIAAVILPFAQKKYEERRSKFSFRMYIKEKLSYIFHMVTYDEIEYIQPNTADNLTKSKFKFREFCKGIRDDLQTCRDTVEPRIAFHYVHNLQKYCNHLYRIRHTIGMLNMGLLKENILANGEKLSKRELRNLYGLLLVIDNFSSITQFHDKFDQLKSVQRHHSENI